MAYIFAQGGRIGDSTGRSVDPDEYERQGAVYTGRRPCFVWYRGELYNIGYYSRPLVRHKGMTRFVLGGIRPPQTPLAVSLGGGSGGSEGLALCAITFLHKAGSRVLCESNFSNVVNLGELAGQGRAWSQIDDVSAELRVTHVRGYVSVDGGTFRMAWEAPYGLTSFEENRRTAQLTFAGPSVQQNGVPPETYYGHAWAGRMFYARSSTYPYRIWWSKPGFPQNVAPASFRDTLDRETITGVWKGRNELLVLCSRAAYMLRQFGGGVDDFIMEKLDSHVGCLTHHGIQEIHNRVWFPAEDGFWIYDGSFRYVAKEIESLYRDDRKANPAAYLDGFAAQHRTDKTYMFFTKRVLRPEFENSELSPGTITWVGYYGDFDPSLAGNQAHPEWTLDMKHRFDSCALYDEDGNLLIGSCDGKIRTEDPTDGDDDGDRIGKEAVIRSGHLLYNVPGDDLEHGKQLPQLWYYIQSELTGWSLYARGGDEEAWRSKLPDNDIDGFWKIDVAASQHTETRQIATSRSGRKTLSMLHVPATVHYFVPERVTGRGFTLELRAVSPVSLKYRGFGGQWAPGPTARGIEERTTISGSITIGGEVLDQYDPPTVIPDTYAPIGTLVYDYGSAAWPITLRLVCTALAYDSELELSDPDLTGAFPDNAVLVDGNTYDFVLTVTDANGVTLDEDIQGSIVCATP